VQCRSRMELLVLASMTLMSRFQMLSRGYAKPAIKASVPMLFIGTEKVTESAPILVARGRMPIN